jgi:hypothetical protein
MPITIMIDLFWKPYFCCVAHDSCFFIITMHIINKRQIIIRIRMLRLYLSAYFEMVEGIRVLIYFKIRKSKIILNLCMIRLKIYWFLKGDTSLTEIFHFIQSYTKIIICSIWLCCSLIQLIKTIILKPIPITIDYNFNAIIFKCLIFNIGRLSTPPWPRGASSSAFPFFFILFFLLLFLRILQVFI